MMSLERPTLPFNGVEHAEPQPDQHVLDGGHVDDVTAHQRRADAETVVPESNTRNVLVTRRGRAHADADARAA